MTRTPFESDFRRTLLTALATLAVACTPQVTSNIHLDQDASGGGGTPADGFVGCPSGYQANSTGDGCAPICAQGYVPNENEDGCVQAPPGSSDAIVCPLGHIPASDTGVCVPVLPVTIQGFLSVKGSGEPIEGATVTLFPATDQTATSDADGYFAIDNVSVAGQVRVIFKAEGYFDAQQIVIIPVQGGAGVDKLVVDASISLTRDPGGGGPPPPTDGTRFVLGTVYAGDSAASGATVHLYNHTLGADVDTQVTDGDGAFSMLDIADAGYTFSLRIEAFDKDQDGVFDYQYEEIWLGGLDRQDLGGNADWNLSNMVIVLRISKREISYTNFVPTVSGITGPTLVTGRRLKSPSGDIIVHFGAETDPSTLEIQLVEVFGSTLGNTLQLANTWNAAGTVLTLDPGQDLVADADPSTLYELRITGLLWADGTAFVPPGSPVGASLRMRFDVATAPVPLVSPQPQFDIAGRADAHQTVTQVQCDSRVCWLLDSSGYFFNGPDDPSLPDFGDSYFNGVTGVDLTWTAIPGAVNYRIYARESGGSGEYRGWHQIPADIEAAFSDLLPDAPVTASGVLAGGSPSWDEFGVGFVGGSVGNPLALGNNIEIAVTSIDVQGVESQIDATRVLRLADTTRPLLVSVAEITSDRGVIEPRVERGAAGIGKFFEVRYSELVDPSSSATWAADSGNITAIDQPTGVSWDNGQSLGAVGLSDTAIYTGLTLDFRGACTSLVAGADPSDSLIVVQDTKGFNTGSVFFLNTSGSGLAFQNTMVISTVDPVNSTIEFSQTIADAGGSGLSTGQFVCPSRAVNGANTTISQPFNSFDTTILVADPSIFYPGQEILVYMNSPSTTTTVRTVRRIQPPQPQPPPLPSRPGTIEFDSTLGIDGDGGFVMARPSPSERELRRVRDLNLSGSFTTSGATLLPFTRNSMESSSVLEGDLLLVDIDGVLDTVADRFFVEVGEVTMQLDDPVTPFDDTDFHVELVPAPGQPNTLPNGLFLQAGITRVLHLADSFRLSGLRDTTNNTGLQQHADQFSFCDPGFTGCRNGIFVY